METLLTEVSDGVGIITLNRPELHNAMNDVLIVELGEALKKMEADPAVRVVVLSAAGKSFCAGGDLNWLKSASANTEEENRREGHTLSRMFLTLNNLSKPTVARVQGAAYGGGVGLVAACDIAIGVFDAQFMLSEVKLGLIPAVISPYVVAAISERKARRYMLSAEIFSAAEAYRIGLLHEIVADEESLDEAIGEIIKALLSGGPQAQAECKDLIRAVSNRTISEEVADDTGRRIARLRVSPEGREGMAAFLEKRRPSWILGQS